MARAIAASTGGIALQVKYIAVGKGLQAIALDDAGRATTDTLKSLVGYVEVLNAKKVTPYQWQIAVDLVGISDAEWNFSEFALCDADKNVIAIYGSASQALIAISTILDNALLSVNLVFGTFPANSIVIEHHNLPLELFQDDLEAAIYSLQRDALKKALADVDRDSRIAALSQQISDGDRDTIIKITNLINSLTSTSLTDIETLKQQVLTLINNLSVAVSRTEMDTLKQQVQQLLDQAALKTDVEAAKQQLLQLINGLSDNLTALSNSLAAHIADESGTYATMAVMSEVISSKEKNIDEHEDIRREFRTKDDELMAFMRSAIAAIYQKIEEERLKNEKLWQYLLDLLTKNPPPPVGDPPPPVGDPPPGVTEVGGTWAMAMFDINGTARYGLTWSKETGLTSTTGIGKTVQAWILPTVAGTTGTWVLKTVTSVYAPLTTAAPLVPTPAIAPPAIKLTAQQEVEIGGVNIPDSYWAFVGWDLWWSLGGPNYMPLNTWADRTPAWLLGVGNNLAVKSLPNANY